MAVVELDGVELAEKLVVVVVVVSVFTLIVVVVELAAVLEDVDAPEAAIRPGPRPKFEVEKDRRAKLSRLALMLLVKLAIVCCVLLIAARLGLSKSVDDPEAETELVELLLLLLIFLISLVAVDDEVVEVVFGVEEAFDPPTPLFASKIFPTPDPERGRPPFKGTTTLMLLLHC